MNNDLISREALKKALSDKDLITYTHEYGDAIPVGWVMIAIDNAPTVEYTFEEAFQKTVCEQRLYCPARPQGEFVEILKDRIEKSICLHCRMNKHCELCEIGRVFLIIDLTDKEMKGYAE